MSWQIEEYSDMVRLSYDGKPGYIEVKKTDEGFVCDIFSDEGNEADAGCYSFFNELGDES